MSSHDEFAQVTEELVQATITFLQVGEDAGLGPAQIQAAFLVAFQSALERANQEASAA